MPVKDLILGLLKTDPSQRLSCAHALRHPCFPQLPRTQLNADEKRNFLKVFDYYEGDIIKRECANLMVKLSEPYDHK